MYRLLGMRLTLSAHTSLFGHSIVLQQEGLLKKLGLLPQRKATSVASSKLSMVWRSLQRLATRRPFRLSLVWVLGWRWFL
jgi:hypothetical protein